MSDDFLMTTWDASGHLRAELARILDRLMSYLRAQRDRGRSVAADAVRGLVIEEGEAEGLVTQLTEHFRDTDRSRQVTDRHEREAIAQRAEAAARQGVWLPLRHAQRAFDLSPEEYDALLLALAVEVDGRFGRIVAYLNDHISRTRPTLGLALAVADVSDSRMSAVAIVKRPIIRDALLDIEGDAPLPGMTLTLSRPMVRRFVDGDTSSDLDDPGVTIRPPQPQLLDRLVLEPAVKERLSIWGDALQSGRSPRPLIVVGSPGSGRSTAACSALFRTALPVVQVDIAPENAVERLRVARREGCWHVGSVVLRIAPHTAIDWASAWTSIDLDRPVALVLTADQLGDATSAAPIESAIVHLEEPSVALRARLWSALLPIGVDLQASELAELATRFPFGPGGIAKAIRRATGDLSLLPTAARRLDFNRLFAAARSVDAATIGPLAQKMPVPYERGDLIVPSSVAAELDLAVAWVRHRHRVLHEWGFVRRVTMGHGLTALFSGPSGTGKTMAAQVLARELGLDLYRIDLSQIMSKYIGETEKHLALLFGAHVGVLFFDEAEVLLGRRHETKEARDRYANVEIAYLLQRMEEYDGVTILATNRMQDIDDAFIRRLHVVIDFPMPSEADRLRIWQGMIPPAAASEPDLDLRALAREFEMSGGQIKNAALAAAFLAAADETSIGMMHLRRAASRELVKSGRIDDRASR